MSRSINYITSLALFATLFLLSACGGSSSPAAPTAPATPEPVIDYDIKQLKFSWPAVTNATYYQLLENADGASGFTQLSGNINNNSIDLDIALHRRVNAQYIVNACNVNACTPSSILSVADNLIPAIGYIKASNSDQDDIFGVKVAISGDGLTLAISASQENSSASGINTNQFDNTAINAGAVYIFIKENNAWQQQAYLKASNTDAGDRFGFALAISADGNTLAVGALLEASNTTAIVNGVSNELNNDVSGAGAVYMFQRSDNNWTQVAYIKSIDVPGSSDLFGSAVALSADGNTLAVGVTGDDSNVAAIGSPGFLNNAGDNNGSVYVYTRNVDGWFYQQFIKPNVTDNDDNFGSAVALSADGNTLAVSAIGESSNAIGINNDMTNNSSIGSGAVYIFDRTSDIWTQQAYIKASNTNTIDFFGSTIDISADGNTLAVGAFREDSNETGTTATGADDSANDAGAAYVFIRTGSDWMQQSYIKSSNTRAEADFAFSLALTADGNTLVVGSRGETSNSNGVAGDQSAGSDTNVGAAYIYVRSTGLWAQQSYLKAPNAGTEYLFGNSIAISTDGSTVAVGSAGEASNANGINGDQLDATTSLSGAVYLY